MPTPRIDYPTPGGRIPASFEAWGSFSPDGFKKILGDPGDAEGLRAALFKEANLDPDSKEAADLLTSFLTATTPPTVHVRLSKITSTGTTQYTVDAAYVSDNTIWYVDLTTGMATLGASADPGVTYSVTAYIIAPGSTADNLRYKATAATVPHPPGTSTGPSLDTEIDAAAAVGGARADAAGRGQPRTAPFSLGFSFTPKAEVVRGVCIVSQENTATREKVMYTTFPAVAQFGAYQLIVPPVPVPPRTRIYAEAYLLDENGRVVYVENDQPWVATYIPLPPA